MSDSIHSQECQNVTRRLTFSSRAQICRFHANHIRAKDGNRADTKTDSAPDPLDHAFLRHAVPDSYSQYAIDVLDESKVSALNHVLLDFLAVVECYFLRGLEEAGVGESQFALKCGLGQLGLGVGSRLLPS